MAFCFAHDISLSFGVCAALRRRLGLATATGSQDEGGSAKGKCASVEHIDLHNYKP
jgi:hypothetical protein